MGRLPFSRVAILDPVHVFSDPHTPDFDRRKQGELRDWLAKARKNNADSCYARVNALSVTTALAILKALVDEIPVLAPAIYFDPVLSVAAYHHRLHETGLLTPGPYLQGVSCHSLTELQAAENGGFDYVFLSPVFSTASHPDAEPLGLDDLAAACSTVKIPIIALGGVNENNAAECLQVGAAGWAGIRAFLK